MLKQQLDQDLKTALLAGDKAKAEVLKMLKSAILYEEVAQKVRETGLPDEQVHIVVAREVKKRAESAEAYEKAGQSDRAATERTEKTILEAYLPQQLTDDELQTIIDTAIAEAGESAQMGQIIGVVKGKVGQSADGGRIAAAVRAKLG